MVTYTQTIRWQQPTNCLSVSDHFLGLALKYLKATLVIRSIFRILSSIYDGAFCENNLPQNFRTWKLGEIMVFYPVSGFQLLTFFTQQNLL